MPSAPVPYPFARPPHPYLTPFARPPHPYLTPFARPPHPYLTPFARPPHPYLTPFARPPHPYLTPFARPPHPYLTPKHWPSSTAPQTGVWHDHILTTFTWVPEITVSLLLNLDKCRRIRTYSKSQRSFRKWQWFIISPLSQPHKQYKHLTQADLGLLVPFFWFLWSWWGTIVIFAGPNPFEH